MAAEFANLETKLRTILRGYRDSFSAKSYSEENDDSDPLMEVFGITPALKRESRQYWGRELGMCWQLLVTSVFAGHCKEYLPAMRMEDDEPCDCFVGFDLAAWLDESKRSTEFFVKRS